MKAVLSKSAQDEFEDMYALHLKEVSGGFISILKWSIALEIEQVPEN